MTDKMDDGVSRERRAYLREKYPSAAGSFTTAADKLELEAEAQRQQEIAKQKAEAAARLRQEEAEKIYLALKASTHPRYDEMEQALTDLVKTLEGLMSKYSNRYWRYLVFTGVAEYSIVWADNPLNKTHEEYLRRNNKDYKRRPFIFTTFQTYDGFSIGYDIEKGVYTYYVLEPTNERYSSGGGDTSRGPRIVSYNPRYTLEKPEGWDVKAALEFQAPEEVAAHFEKYIQKVIAAAQVELPKNMYSLVKKAPGRLALACLVVCMGMFMRVDSEEVKAQEPEPKI